MKTITFNVGDAVKEIEVSVYMYYQIQAEATLLKYMRQHQTLDEAVQALVQGAYLESVIAGENFSEDAIWKYIQRLQKC